jgi:hypothetical protein
MRVVSTPTSSVCLVEWLPSNSDHCSFRRRRAPSEWVMLPRREIAVSDPSPSNNVLLLRRYLAATSTQRTAHLDYLVMSASLSDGERRRIRRWKAGRRRQYQRRYAYLRIVEGRAPQARPKPKRCCAKRCTGRSCRSAQAAPCSCGRRAETGKVKAWSARPRSRGMRRRPEGTKPNCEGCNGDRGAGERLRASVTAAQVQVQSDGAPNVAGEGD